MNVIKALTHHIIAGVLSVITLINLFSVEQFNLIQTSIMLLAIVYCVYVYSVYWDITKN